MTSGNSFLNRIKENAKRRLWTWLLAELALFAAMPLWTLLEMVNLQNQINDALNSDPLQVTWLRQQMRQAFVGEAGYSIFYLFLAACIAILFAIQGFSYLYSQRKADLYLSVPVSAGERFRIIVFSGIGTFAVLYLFNLVLVLLIGSAYGLVTPAVLLTAAGGFLMTVAGFAAAYLLAVLAALLTGNEFTALLACGVLFTYEPAVRTILDILKSEFWVSWCNYAQQISNEKTFWITPLYYLGGFFSRITYTAGGGAVCDGSFGFTYAKTLAITLAGTAVLWGLARLAYRKRETESYNRAIAFPKMKPVIEFLVLVPVSACIGAAAASYASEYGAVLFGGAVIAGLITHCLIRLIYERELKAVIRGLIPAAAGILAGCFVLAFFRFDLSGYDSYSPDVSDVAAVSAAMESDYNGFSRYEIGRSDYDTDPTAHILENMNSTDEAAKQAVIAMEQSWQQAGFPDYGFTTEWRWGSRELNEDYENSNVWIVRYTLKNGRTVIRRFYASEKVSPAELEAVTSDAAYQTARYQIYDDDFTEWLPDMAVSYSDGVRTTTYTGDRKELLEALRAGMHSYDYDLLCETLPCGTLSFSMTASDEQGYTIWYEWDYPVYSSFSDTVSVLEEAGIDTRADRPALEAEEVDELDVEYYQAAGCEGVFPVSEDRDQDVTVSFTDRADLEEILPYAVPAQLLGGFDSGLHSRKVDYGYSVMTTCSKEANITGRYVSLQFDETVPDIVTDALLGADAVQNVPQRMQLYEE